jgi:hypothetical protein
MNMRGDSDASLPTVKYWKGVCLNARARNWSRMQFFEQNFCRWLNSMKTEVSDIYIRCELDGTTYEACEIRYCTKVAYCIWNIISKSTVANMASMVTLRSCPTDLTQINLYLNLSPSTQPSNKTITSRIHQAKLKIYKTFHLFATSCPPYTERNVP